MSTEHDPDHESLEPHLGAELRRRAETVHGAPFTLADVQGRARDIRRRRHGVALAAAAAVALVAVPVGLLGVGQDRDRPVQPVETPSDAPPPRLQGTFPLGLAGLPDGDPAQLPYLRLDDDVLVTPEGEVQLDAPYQQVLPYGDGYVAVGPGENPSPVDTRLYRLDQNYQAVEDLGPVADRIVASPDGSRIAWTEIGSNGATLAVATDGGEPERTSVEGSYGYPIGFLPDGIAQASEGVDGTTYSVVRDGAREPVAGFQFLWDSSPETGLLVGQTSYDDATESQCSGAREDGSADLLWEECNRVLGSLNPGGDLVIAFESPLLPLSPSVSVLDSRTGETVVRYAGPGTVAGAAWEDDDTVLALVEQDGEQGIVRLGLDGSAELTMEPLPTQGMSVELFFAERPRGSL